MQGTRPLGTVHVDQSLEHQELAAWRRYLLLPLSLVVQVEKRALSMSGLLFPIMQRFRVDEAGLQSEEAEGFQHLD